MVTALKVSTTPSRNSACNTGVAIGASVKMKASMVAMSGAIMPAPLAKPLMVTSVPAIRTRAVASFGKVSVVMIARAASLIGIGRGRGREFGQDAVERLRRQRLADHAGRRQKHFAGLAADRGGGELRGEGASRAAAFAGKGVGIAGIDHERTGACALTAAPGTIRPAQTDISSG